MPKLKITKAEIDKIESNEIDQFFWDSTLKGFGLKVTKAGSKSYVVQYRMRGGRGAQVKRITIGKHGSPWTSDGARLEAKRILGQVALGEDPAVEKQEDRHALTVTQLCKQYLLHGLGTKKVSTLSTDRGRIERHILPLLGFRRLDDLTPADMRKFLKNVADGATATDQKTKSRGRAIVRGGKGTASRTLGLLGGIFSYAVDAGMMESNPVRGVKRFPDKKNERFLSFSELGLLGGALESAANSGVNAKAIAIIKLLMLTGARRGEIERLRIEEVDLSGRRLKLADSKTGQKTIHLNNAAIGILHARLRNRTDRGFVFEGARSDTHYVGTPRVWAGIRALAGLEKIRLHDLRHSFASVGVAAGAPLMVVGALLGHSDHSTTQRYAHLADDPVSAASEQIGSLIADAMHKHPQSSQT